MKKETLTIKKRLNMEITKTKLRGHEIDVLFVGTHYYFWSAYCGVIAIAKREGFETGTPTINASTHFTIITGNQHCVGGSLTDCAVEKFVKTFITKQEQKFVPTDVTYESKSERLDKGTIVVDFKFYEK